MAFTRGLFYPWIDIEDEAWLKTTALYWERIQTIVPEGIREPYRCEAARELYNAQILEPFLVDSQMRDVRSLADAVRQYLETPEGIAVLSGDRNIGFDYLHYEKLPEEVRDIVHMHPAKLPEIIRRNYGALHLREEDGWIPVDRRFAAFYMTLLATTLSERHGLGLLTDTGAFDRLATTAKLGGTPWKIRSQWGRMRHAGRLENPDVPPTLAQGLMANLVLERLEIDPATSIRSIIAFRNTHSDELGRFRATIWELTSSIAEDIPVQRMRQELEDIYANKVQPAIGNLKKALTGSKIRFVADNFMKVAYFSAGASSVPFLLGLGAPYVLLAGAGATITTATALYRIEKERQLRENPFSYLFSAERAFRRADG